MKKTIRNLLVLVLTFSLTLSLCGCGKVNALIKQIDQIGDVTLQSGDAIQTAEVAYAALNEDQQAKIENYSSEVRLDEGAVYVKFSLDFTEDLPKSDSYDITEHFDLVTQTVTNG
jgi:hypothetical protein